ncbi:MAG TPA: GTP-binding protein, partial [Victivallales bacterium]|nr:GTP-binding protein [Victivallales bacterium]
VIDGAIVIFSAVEGVEAQSEKVWRQSDKYNLPRIAFINKLDRFGASFKRTLEQMKKKFPNKVMIPIQIPDGEENNFNGIIDLIRKKNIKFLEEDGSKLLETDLSIEEANFKKAFDDMLSALSDFSDKIAEEFLSTGDVNEKLLFCEIRKLVIEGKIVPVLCGSAKKNIGIQPLLDAIVRYLPSPEDRPVFQAYTLKENKLIECSYKDNEFRGLVFKIIASNSGDLLYLRTYSGNLKLGDVLLNPRTGEKVKAKRLLRLFSKNIEAINECGPGDIIGLIGPSNTFTGDTLCSQHKAVLLEKIIFPEPVISMALEPKNSKDKDKLEFALNTICREDPTLFYKKNEATGQMILSGMGELHLEISTNKLRKEFHVEFRCGEPQVAYRETLSSIVETEGIFDRMIGENRYYATVKIKFEPIMRLENGLEAIIQIKNKESINLSWIKAAEQTLINSLKTGGNLGYPLLYLRAIIIELTGNESTNESAVSAAVMDAVNKAIKTGTKVLEPIVKVEIISPEQYIGDINGSLQARRALINGIESIGGELKKLVCEVPLSEMFGFSKSLPKLSGGRASFTMEPYGYQPVELEVLEKKAGIV